MPEQNIPYYDSIGFLSEEMERTPILTPEEEKEAFDKLFKPRGRNKRQARDKLIKSNLRLVIKIAGEYKTYGLPLADLINEGIIGLMRAIEKYDRSKKTKFSFYASLWIRQSITRALSNKSKTIRIPHGLINESFKVKRVFGELSDELGRDPTYEEIGKRCSISPKKVKKIFETIPSVISINTPAQSSDAEEECNLENIIPDSKNKLPTEFLCDKEDNKNLTKFLCQLTDRECYILVHRFGLENNEKETLEVIGKKFDLTRERIRQIEKESLSKLKKMFDRYEEMH